MKCPAELSEASLNVDGGQSIHYHVVIHMEPPLLISGNQADTLAGHQGPVIEIVTKTSCNLIELAGMWTGLR